MVDRSELLTLGIVASVSGCLVGGLMLGVGMVLAMNGQRLGWLVLLGSAPVSALLGWLFARRLAREL